MRAPFIPALALALAAAVGAGCGATTANGAGTSSPASPSSSSDGNGQAGAAATDFTLRDVDGRTVHLSDYAGKVVLLDFWATWCVPCEAEIPLLDKLYRQYGGQGFVVLGIAMDGPETIANVAPFARRYQLGFPVLLDEETKVTAVYNPKRTAPLSILVDKKGRIARVREGYDTGDEKFIEADVRGLLAQQ